MENQTVEQDTHNDEPLVNVIEQQIVYVRKSKRKFVILAVAIISLFFIVCVAAYFFFYLEEDKFNSDISFDKKVSNDSYGVMQQYQSPYPEELQNISRLQVDNSVNLHNEQNNKNKEIQIVFLENGSQQIIHEKEEIVLQYIVNGLPDDFKHQGLSLFFEIREHGVGDTFKRLLVENNKSFTSVVQGSKTINAAVPAFSVREDIDFTNFDMRVTLTQRQIKPYSDEEVEAYRALYQKNSEEKVFSESDLPARYFDVPIFSTEKENYIRIYNLNEFELDSTKSYPATYNVIEPVGSPIQVWHDKSLVIEAVNENEVLFSLWFQDEKKDAVRAKVGTQIDFSIQGELVNNIVSIYTSRGSILVNRIYGPDLVDFRLISTENSRVVKKTENVLEDNQAIKDIPKNLSSIEVESTAGPAVTFTATLQPVPGCKDGYKTIYNFSSTFGSSEDIILESCLPKEFKRLIHYYEPGTYFPRLLVVQLVNGNRTFYEQDKIKVISDGNSVVVQEI